MPASHAMLCGQCRGLIMLACVVQQFGEMLGRIARLLILHAAKHY